MGLIKKLITLLVIVAIVGVLANMLMKMQGGGGVNVKVERIVNKPIITVFGELADHANWKSFPGISDSKLLTAGIPLKNGEGAVREITAVGGFTVVEEITDFLPPVRMEYQIKQSSPIKLKHEYGRLTLRPEGLLKTKVIWESKGVVDMPLFDAILGWFVSKEVERSFSNILESMNK